MFRNISIHCSPDCSVSEQRFRVQLVSAACHSLFSGGASASGASRMGAAESRLRTDAHGRLRAAHTLLRADHAEHQRRAHSAHRRADDRRQRLAPTGNCDREIPLVLVMGYCDCDFLLVILSYYQY